MTGKDNTSICIQDRCRNLSSADNKVIIKQMKQTNS